jgi:hypothetical protein
MFRRNILPPSSGLEWCEDAVRIYRDIEREVITQVHRSGAFSPV